MKPIYFFSRIIVSIFLFIIGLGNALGQISYTGSPNSSSNAPCPPSITESCGQYSFLGTQIKAYVTNISGNTISIRVRKCNGLSFTTGGDVLLKENNICGSIISNAFMHNGSNGITLTFNANFTGTRNYRITFSSSNGARYYSNPITITGTQLQPNLVCGNAIVTPNTLVQGQPATFSFPITNNGSGNYSGTLRMMWRSSSTGVPLGTSIYGLNAGASHTFTHSVSSLSSTPGNYVLRIEKSDGTVVCSKSVSVVSAQPNLSAGNATLTPNPITQGTTPTTFRNTIYNSGNGNFSGMVYLSLHTSTGSLITDIVSQQVNINANSSYTLIRPSNPINTPPGTYKIVTKYRNANGNFVELNSTNYTINAPITCINWSGTPPVGDKLIAAEYLCTNGIIINNQNGTDNANFALTRELLAKIIYLGLYKGNIPNSPAVHFPVPFIDMQGSSSQYMEAIKTLAYLQFNNDKTPFDRDLINFNPSALIPRKYVVKALAEAFNISKSNATPSPFTDVNPTDEMYGYIKKFHELGLINGNQQYVPGVCQTGTCFHPNDNITREDAFLLLYRILVASNINRPTTAQLNNIANYFVPGNNRPATMGKVPSIDQANFNHYQKTSFSIAGRGLPLDFTHTYNSLLTELPKGYFEEETSGQSFSPLGIGWTHTYNIYGVKVDGYTVGSYNQSPKIIFYYPDGSINVFNYNTNANESIGVYDVMTKSPIPGGERITITTKRQMRYVFESVNNGKFYLIKSIKDRNNNGLKINWENYISTRHRISSVQEEFNNGSIGRSLTFNYASRILPYLSSVSDNSIGRTIYFNVALQTRNLTSYTDPKGQITQYSYDDSNNYNKSNLLTEIILPKGNKIRNTYFDRKLRSSKTFNQNNVVTSTTNINWTPNYSSSGYNSSATITDPQNRTTHYTHNTLGNPTQIVEPTGTTTINSYGSGNNANLPTSITVNGQNSSINYDSRGNVLSISKNGITNTFTYNNFNDVLSHTDGRGFTTHYSYDGVGNLISIQRPSGGGNTNISRNNFGQAQSITNPSGITTQLSYNNNGLVSQVSLPLGITTSATYDNASRLLSSTDANGKTTSYSYDANDNLVNSTDANQQIVQHTYDANDNHLTIRNPKNEVQTNTYNFDDDSLASETFGAHTKSYTYNADGSLATHTRGNGTFTYTYDNTTGRLTSDGHTHYGYDNRGNVTSITNANGTLTLNYDGNNRMTSYSDYYGNTVYYSYDNNNNVTTITYPGNKQVNYVYDANNRCTSVADWNGKVTSYTYLTDDRVSKITLPNGTSTDYSYDSAGRMTGIINKKSDGTVITSYTFTLDNAGNHLTETLNEPSITAGLQTIGNQTINYGQYPYNRIQSQGNTSFAHNTAGAVTQAGNHNFTYDINDNLLTAPNSSFSYDGAGNRRAKTVNGVDTRYVLSILGMSQVLMETDGSNIAQNYYVYGPTGLLYRVKADNATYSYYHYDYRGSTTAMTNEAQSITHSYSYDPFGKVLAKTEADANPFQYVGQHGVQYESPTLTFMRARYYDPTLGRFLSEDPIWHLNLYPYADNNPIMGIDPNGKDKQHIIDGFVLTMDVISDKIIDYSRPIASTTTIKILNIKQKVFGYVLNGTVIWADSEKKMWDKVAESLGLVASDLITSKIASYHVGVLKTGVVKGYLVGLGISSALMDNYYGIRYGYNSEQFYKYQSDVSKGWGLIIDNGISYYNSVIKAYKTKSTSLNYGSGSIAPMPKW